MKKILVHLADDHPLGTSVARLSLIGQTSDRGNGRRREGRHHGGFSLGFLPVWKSPEAFSPPRTISISVLGLKSSMPPSLMAPLARYACRLGCFITNPREQCGLEEFTCIEWANSFFQGGRIAKKTTKFLVHVPPKVFIFLAICWRLRHIPHKLHSLRGAGTLVYRLSTQLTL